MEFLWIFALFMIFACVGTASTDRGNAWYWLILAGANVVTLGIATYVITI